MPKFGNDLKPEISHATAVVIAWPQPSISQEEEEDSDFLIYSWTYEQCMRRTAVLKLWRGLIARSMSTFFVEGSAQDNATIMRTGTNQLRKAALYQRYTYSNLTSHKNGDFCFGWKLIYFRVLSVVCVHFQAKPF